VAGGYFGREQQTAETFGARIAGTGEGPFLRTGDLGFLLEGELYLASRLKDLIVIRGKNHHPQDIEATVERSHSMLRVGCSAAFAVSGEGGEERVVVVAEVSARTPDLAAVRAAIRGQVADAHGLRLQDVVLIKPGASFKTSSGKIQRRTTREAYLAGTLELAEARAAEPG
jgi:acyl-CoA synthetase (AMP-forming)/AMP-acid ligase II